MQKFHELSSIDVYTAIKFNIMIMGTKMKWKYSYMEMKMINTENSIMKYIEMPSSIILMLLIIYLLMTLIATVKISKTNSGTLRKI